MAELHLDRIEVGIIMTGLTFIDRDRLTPEGKAALVRLAGKLGDAHAEESRDA